LAKQIQWKWPKKYGDDKVVVMFGGFHIEMAALKTLGDWLDGSGWVQALVQAEITTPGTAESFLRASHVTTQRELIRLLLLHCTSCNIEPMTIIAREKIMTEKISLILKIGAIREERKFPSSSTGQLCWN